MPSQTKRRNGRSKYGALLKKVEALKFSPEGEDLAPGDLAERLNRPSAKGLYAYFKKWRDRGLLAGNKLTPAGVKFSIEKGYRQSPQVHKVSTDDTYDIELDTDIRVDEGDDPMSTAFYNYVDTMTPSAVAGKLATMIARQEALIHESSQRGRLMVACMRSMANQAHEFSRALLEITQIVADDRV